MFHQISTVIIYAGIVQGFYLAVLLNHNKSKNPANKYLSILLIALAFSIIHSIFIIPEFRNGINEYSGVKEPFIMLIIPLIWLYVKKMGDPSYRFQVKTMIHFLPFLIFLIKNSAPFLHSNLDPSSPEFLQYSIISTIIIGIVILVQYSIYLINIFKMLKEYKDKTLQELSSTEKVDLGWLKTCLYVFLAIFEVLVVMFIISIHRGNVEQFNIMVSVIFSIIIFILGFKGQFQQSIFSNIDAPVTEEKPGHAPEKPDIAQPVPTELKPDGQMVKQLIEYMEKKKPYRDPDLSLTSLAKNTGISRSMLSETINSGLGSNFYDFINKYRLEEVKTLMSSPKGKNYTLLALAYEAGFQSKSTFNNFFKKNMGVTPSKYREGLP